MQKVVSSLKKNWIRNSLITVYVLLVLGISATARAEYQTMPIFLDEQPSQASMFVGQVAVSLGGHAFLAVDGTKFYKLAANIDLSEYNGLQVVVEAYELQYGVEPVLELNNLDPLRERSERAKVFPVLVVLGITEVQ